MENKENLQEEVEVMEPEVEEAVVESADAQVEEWENRYKRLQADFENFKRRTAQEKTQLSGFVKAGVIEELLPVLDNFERAVAAPATEETKVFLEGFKMIHQSLISLLEKQGLAMINAVGEAFDPNYHQAIMRVPSEEYADDIVCEVLQTGYTVDGKVIRPAMVKVVHND